MILFFMDFYAYIGFTTFRVFGPTLFLNLPINTLYFGLLGWSSIVKYELYPIIFNLSMTTLLSKISIETSLIHPTVPSFLQFN